MTNIITCLMTFDLILYCVRLHARKCIDLLYWNKKTRITAQDGCFKIIILKIKIIFINPLSPVRVPDQPVLERRAFVSSSNNNNINNKKNKRFILNKKQYNT